jgi:hypothetical protein
MVKLYLALFLSACLIYAAHCGGDYHEDNIEDNDEQDLISHIKQFKELLLKKKQHKPKPVKAVFVEIACEVNTCPKDCPGSCGSYQDSLVCVCKHASCKFCGRTYKKEYIHFHFIFYISVVNPCSAENVKKGLDLHPYIQDASKYIQCGPAPGLAYIKSCPSGLVWDNKNCYCNYPWALGHH